MRVGFRSLSTLRAGAGPTSRNAVAVYRCRTALATVAPKGSHSSIICQSTVCTALLDTRFRAFSTSLRARTDAPSTMPAGAAPPTEPATPGPFAHLPPYKPPTRGILSRLPASWVPYAQLMRVEQTGGLYAFYMAHLVGVGWAGCMATPALAPSQLLYVAGATLLFLPWYRGAACISNDAWDVEFDRKVARCRHRPIARGAVTERQAWIWWGTNVAAAGGIIFAIMPNPWVVIASAAPSLAVLSTYPLLKRVTNFPQFILAAPLAWAATISCSALGVDPWTAQDAMHSAATACMVGSLWAYYTQLDYVNACQDTADDVKAGVKSLAVRFQNQRVVLGLFSTLQLSLMVTAGMLAGLGPTYFAVACGGNAAILYTMNRTVTRDRPDICAWWFRRGSLLIGGTMALGIFSEYYRNKLRSARIEEEAEAQKVLS